jgi:hypothetical protein
MIVKMNEKKKFQPSARKPAESHEILSEELLFLELLKLSEARKDPDVERTKEDSDERASRGYSERVVMCEREGTADQLVFQPSFWQWKMQKAQSFPVLILPK